MKVLSFGLTTGSGWWRVRIPLEALVRNGFECRMSTNAINDEELSWADVVILKNVTDQHGIAAALAMREAKGTKLIMDLDDDLRVGDAHPLKRVYDTDDVTFTQRQTAKAMDLLTCTTEYLASKLRPLNPNVKVLPNCYDPDWFNVKQRKHDGSVRIGWTGGSTHEGDLLMIAPVIKRIKDKYDVQIVARGDTRIKKMWGDTVEYYPTVPFPYFPEALASMAIDIGICPLEDNEFNRCKSEIKAMEYGLLGIPAVCSPTIYANIPVAIIARTEDEWVEELGKLIEGEELRKIKGRTLKAWVEENRNINHNWKLWEAAYG